MRISFGVVLFLALFFSGIAEAKRTHMVFFEGTDYELNVYRVYGKEDGKTILLIGGIQGDEPGGFLSADIYADMSLSKGNLIVVPRANFHSIVLNQRQVNEDMNRKFAEDSKPNYETKVVAILKDLIAESDCLLNLHDGSGFYSEVWVDDDRNPKKFGQSVIADCERREKDGLVIELGDIGRRVVDKINRDIENNEYHFHFNNHNTFSEHTIHKAQRKSATYYALTKCGIPAFGVESSKSLPLEMKIRHHIHAINAFMDEFGVVPELPSVNLEEPDLKYLVITVNDTQPIVVRCDQILTIRPNDVVSITHIEANFERGLSADILGFGSVNDFRKPLAIDRSTRITVRKDFYPCGSVYLALDENGGKDAGCITVSDKKGKGGSFLLYRVKVNGKELIMENYSTIRMIKGDIFELEDVISDAFDPSRLQVNFKGYVGPESENTGEDRGCRINTAKDLWPNYSLDRKGLKYQVVTHGENAIIGKLFVELDTPVLNYMLIKTEGQPITCFENGGSILFGDLKKLGRTLTLVDVISNVEKISNLEIRISSQASGAFPLKINTPIVVGHDMLNNQFFSSPHRIEVLRDELLIGSVSINYTREMDRDEQIEKPVNH